MFTDEEILDLLEQDKDYGAKVLMEQYSSLIRSTCASKLRSQEDIDECVNDVFAEFCLNHSRFDKSKGTLRNYLCTIAERRAVDRFRKNCRRQKIENEVLERYKEEKDIHINQTKQAEQLEEAMEQLPPLDQQILSMHYYNGLSYGKIAEELDMKYENVKKRGSRGKKKLLYFILISILIFGITASAVNIMKRHGWLPSWFPFYDLIMSEESSDQDETVQKRKGEDPIKTRSKEEETEDNQEEEIKQSGVAGAVHSIKEAVSGVKKYQFSLMDGLIWSDIPSYEMVKNTQKFVKDDVTYELDNVFYQNGIWKIDIRLTCSDMERVYDDIDSYEELTPEEKAELFQNKPNGWSYNEAHYLEKAYLQSAGDRKFFLEYQKGHINSPGEEYIFIASYYGKWVPEEDGADKIDVSIVLPEGNEFFVTMKKLDVKEYSESSEDTSEGVKRNSAVVNGIYMKTGLTALKEGMAIVNLYQENPEEYKIDDLITRGYFWYQEGEIEHPVLIDSAGNSYERCRINVQDTETETGYRRGFEIYFRNIEPGEYILRIPQLCLRKEAMTEPVEIDLPMEEDDYLGCDQTVLFDDGTGLHITGIRRHCTITYQYNLSNGQVDIIEGRRWDYELLYEPVSGSPETEPQFVIAKATGTASNGQSVNASVPYIDDREFYALSVESEDIPESLNVQFYSPVYVLKKEVLFDITLQE